MQEKPLNFVTNDAVNTQDSLPLMEVAYSGAVTKRAAMIKGRSIFGSGGHTPLMQTLSYERAIEIDTCFDFKIAQLLYADKHGNGA